jgi:hypothetical protein
MIIGYGRYLKARREYITWMFLLVPLVSFFVVLSLNNVAIAPAELLPFLGRVSCIVCGVLMLTSYMYYLVLEGCLDAHALVTFQMTSLKQSVIALLALRRLSIKYALILGVTQAYGLLLLPGSLLLLWLFPLVVFAREILVLRLDEQVWRWSNVTRPLEQSRWSKLAPRIQAWAKRLNVSVRSMHVYDSATVYISSGRVSGVVSPMLFMNELYMSKTDWRQQDILLVDALLMVQTKLLQHEQLMSRVRSLINILFAVGMVLGTHYIVAHSPFTLARLFVLADWTAIVLLAFYAAARIISATGAKTRFERIKRMTAEITGDVIATVVAWNTITVLSIPYKVETHLAPIIKFIQQQRPCAPWANQRVPSAIPFDKGLYTLTVPLEQAGEPAPVPTASYEMGTVCASHLSS